MTLAPAERQQQAEQAYRMREFRKSPEWDILSIVLTDARDRILADMAGPRDFGLEATARARGELRAITWLLGLPEEIANAGRQ